MKKLDVLIEGLRHENYYPGASFDLSEVAVAIDNSSGGISWMLILKSGQKFQVKPTKADYGYTFTKLLNDIENCKITPSV